MSACQTCGWTVIDGACACLGWKLVARELPPEDAEVLAVLPSTSSYAIAALVDGQWEVDGRLVDAAWAPIWWRVPPPPPPTKRLDGTKVLDDQYDWIACLTCGHKWSGRHARHDAVAHVRAPGACLGGVVQVSEWGTSNEPCERCEP